MSAVGRSRTWVFALGSVLVVALLVGSAYIAHHSVVNTRGTPPVAAPAAAPLDVIAATKPGPSYELIADDESAGHIVALSSTGQPICPPIGFCPPAALLTSFVVFDAGSGAILNQTPLGTAAMRSVMLLVDDQSHVAYAVAPRSVSLFSTETGAALGGYALPSSLAWQTETGGSYDPASRTLILAGDGQMALLDAATGATLAQVPLSSAPPGTYPDGPVLDTQTSTLYLLTHGTVNTQSTLLAYDATTLKPLSQLPEPGATGLGPLTPDGRDLTLYEASGAVALQPIQRDLRTATAAETMSAAWGARAIGWNLAAGSSGDMYVVTATGIDERNMETGRVLATLPMRVSWSGPAPLPVDRETGTVFLPGAHGQIVIIHGASVTGASRLNADTAVVLAHAALAAFLPYTNQDPPFISPDTFLLSASTQGQSLPMTYWIHYVDFQWTLGPYPGTTSAIVAPASHTGASGGYLVTFTIRWNEDFWRTHSWACLVAPDGSVSLRSDSGDIVP